MQMGYCEVLHKQAPKFVLSKIKSDNSPGPMWLEHMCSINSEGRCFNIIINATDILSIDMVLISKKMHQEYRYGDHTHFSVY